MSTRLSRLPPELITELALFLQTPDLKRACEGLIEFRRFSDPDHPLWRTLYRRDLSVWPLPPGERYRETYYLGMRRCSTLYPIHQHDNVKLALWGYDSLIARLLDEEKLYVADYLDDIAEMGHNVVVQLVANLSTEKTRVKATLAAARRGYLNIVKYLTGLLVNPYTLHLFSSAAESKNIKLVDYLLDVGFPNADLTVYNQLLERAIDCGNVLAVQHITDRLKSQRHS